MKAAIWFSAVFSCLALVSGAFAGSSSDVLFGPQENPVGIPENGFVGAITATGFKKIPPGEGMNQWVVDMEAGAFEARSGGVPKSEIKNLYLAFAVDVRYKRECYGAKNSVLCKFLHTGVSMSGHLSWSDLQDTNRYEIVLIPLEYVTGRFGKEGLDLGITKGAFYVTIGGRIEYLRDLGLALEHHMLAAVSGSVNYASETQPLGVKTGFRWIGSVRLYAGAIAGQVENVSLQHGAGIGGGIEGQIGIAFDLEKGTVAFTDTNRLDGDFGFGSSGYRLSQSTNRLELKYLHSVCQAKAKGGCERPRIATYGGGIRYEYLSSAYEATDEGAALGKTGRDQSIHRLIFFAELARF